MVSIFYKMNPEQLYEHYNSTNEQQKEFLAKRDRFTIYLLLTVVVYALFISYPQVLTEAADAYAKDALKFNGTLINFSVLNTGLIYLLLWLLMQYYQICLTIEKWYDYLYRLEDKLSSQYFDISREGKFYTDGYPIMKNLVNFLYTWVLPLGFTSMSIVRVSRLLKSGVYSWIDIAGLLLIAMLSLLYFSDRNLRWGYLNSKTHNSLGFWKRVAGFIRIDVKESEEHV